MEMCPRCYGGEIESPNCPACDGSGMVRNLDDAKRPEPLPSPFLRDEERVLRIKQQKAEREAEKHRHVRIVKKENTDEEVLSTKEQAKRKKTAEAFKARQQKRFKAAERRERMTPEQRRAADEKQKKLTNGRKRAMHKGNKKTTYFDESVIPDRGYCEEDGSRYHGQIFRDHGQFGSMPMHDEYD